MLRGTLCRLPLILLLAGCEAGGGGSSPCSEICPKVGELCGITEADCSGQCATEISGKTSTSVKAAAECTQQATTCSAAEACRDELEEQPIPPPQTGQNTSGSASTICNKVVQCGMPSSQRADCLREVQKNTALLGYVVDSAAFASCINATSCAALKSRPDESVVACLDLGPIQCQGDSLKVCNNKGKCMNMDCRWVCEHFGAPGLYHHCGFDSDQQHDVCYCSA